MISNDYSIYSDISNSNGNRNPRRWLEEVNIMKVTIELSTAAIWATVATIAMVAAAVITVVALTV